MSCISLDKYATVKSDSYSAGSIFATCVLWLQSKHMHGSLRTYKGVSVWRVLAAAQPGTVLNK